MSGLLKDRHELKESKRPSDLQVCELAVQLAKDDRVVTTRCIALCSAVNSGCGSKLG